MIIIMIEYVVYQGERRLIDPSKPKIYTTQINFQPIGTKKSLAISKTVNENDYHIHTTTRNPTEDIFRNW